MVGGWEEGWEGGGERNRETHTLAFMHAKTYAHTYVHAYRDVGGTAYIVLQSIVDPTSGAVERVGGRESDGRIEGEGWEGRVGGWEGWHGDAGAWCEGGRGWGRRREGERETEAVRCVWLGERRSVAA